MDSPDLIVTCVVGYGEVESGPIAGVSMSKNGGRSVSIMPSMSFTNRTWYPYPMNKAKAPYVLCSENVVLTKLEPVDMNVESTAPYSFCSTYLIACHDLPRCRLDFVAQRVALVDDDPENARGRLILRL
ncbi:hypothetical protein N7540_012731 [Penicillium herquei]|nr:hypothetical protein N7540_012731 [Penicillium herquei]